MQHKCITICLAWEQVNTPCLVHEMVSSGAGALLLLAPLKLNSVQIICVIEQIRITAILSYQSVWSQLFGTTE